MKRGWLRWSSALWAGVAARRPRRSRCAGRRMAASPCTSSASRRRASPRTLRQQFDFSCGSAAVATLLTHHYGKPVTEREVFAQMFERGDQAKIRKEGFLDARHEALSRVARISRRRLRAAGRAAASRSSCPAIVLLSERGYRHFVVVKGIARGRVLVGDPAMGTRAISFERFSQLWVNHILFVVHNRRDTAQFNDDGDWHVAPAAPLSAGDGSRAVCSTRCPCDGREHSEMRSRQRTAATRSCIVSRRSRAHGARGRGRAHRSHRRWPRPCSTKCAAVSTSPRTCTHRSRWNARRTSTASASRNSQRAHCRTSAT